MLLSDPKLQRNTFRRNANEKAVPGNHNYGCVVGGGTITYGASSWRHLPYEFNEATQVRHHGGHRHRRLAREL